MTQSVTGPCMYLSLKNEKLIGINGAYVDDLLRCGSPVFEDLCKVTYDRFKTNGTEELPLTSAGLNMRSRQDDELGIDQVF